MVGRVRYPGSELFQNPGQSILLVSARNVFGACVRERGVLEQRENTVYVFCDVVKGLFVELYTCYIVFSLRCIIHSI